MRIAVIGASGGTGAAAVRQALGHGHEVTAIMRDVSLVADQHERLKLASADARELEDMRRVLPGHDAVLSAIGAAPGKEVDVYSTVISNVLYAMAESDIRRLVAVSAAGVFHRDDSNLGMRARFSIKGSLSGIYDDLERMEERIAASSVEWVVARPTRMTDGSQTGDYRIGLDGRPLKGGRKISHADVAAFIVKAAETDTWLGRAVSLSY